MSLSSAAQDVEEDFSDEIVVISVDDFADLAEDYGCIVVRESDNFPVPYIAKNFTVTLTSNSMTKVDTDNSFFMRKLGLK